VKLNLKIIIISLLFISKSTVASEADNLSQSKNEIILFNSNHEKLPIELLPKVVFNKINGSISIDFKDGRVAQLVTVKRDNSIKLSLDAEILENTCIPNFKPLHCKYNVSIIPELYTLIWVEHPDEKLKGKILQHNKFDENIFTDRNLWFWEHTKRNFRDDNVFLAFTTPHSKKYNSKIHEPYLQCDDMSWIDQTLPKVNGQYLIHEWASEANVNNIEAGVAQNQMVKSYLEVSATRIENKLIFKDYLTTQKQAYTDVDITVGFSNGDVLGWSLRKDGNFCETTLKIDRATVVATIFENIFIPTQANFTTVSGFRNIEDFNETIKSAVHYDNLAIFTTELNFLKFFGLFEEKQFGDTSARVTLKDVK
jgi:hypothetical protein